MMYIFCISFIHEPYFCRNSIQIANWGIDYCFVLIASAMCIALLSS